MYYVNGASVPSLHRVGMTLIYTSAKNIELNE